MSRLQPDPKVYPKCSKCGVPYILRLGISWLGGGEQWAWFRDCKHRTSPPETVDTREQKPRRPPQPIGAGVTRRVG